MIKVKDGYAKLIGTTYAGSANRVLLSNGGDHSLGNASGNIPLSNGVVNTNLNADLWDGKHWNDLQIGGRNYYKQYSGCRGQTKDSSIKGYIINSSNGINRITLLGFDGYAGHWTVSFEIKADTACTVYVNLCDFEASSAYGESSITSVTTSYVKHTYVFLNVNKYNTSDSFNGFLDIENSLGIKIYVKNIKIEKGTKATDWSPAPEDLVDLYSELTITGKKNFSASYKNALNIIRSDSTNGNSVINFSNASKTLGYIGVSGSGSKFGEGHPIFDTGVDHFKIWYSENDGSDSGLDADLLDGLHLSYIVNSNNKTDLSLENNAGYILHYTNINATTNTPYSIIGGNQCTVLQVLPGNSTYSALFAIGFGSDYPAIRRKLGTTTWGAWSKINAGYADSSKIASRLGLNGIDNSTTYGTYAGIIQSTSDGPEASSWHNSIKILHNNSDGYYTQLAHNFTGSHGLWHRSNRAGTISRWYRLIDDQGGTIAGTFTIKRNASVIRYINTDETVWGWLGFNAKDNPVAYMGDGTTCYNLIHSGNIGSQSVKYADNANTLDGLDSSNFFRQLGTNEDINTYADSSNKNGILYINTTSPSSINAPFSYGSILSLNVLSASWMIACSDSGNLSFRNRWWSESGKAWGAWKKFAFISDIPTKTSQLTNDSGFVTGGPYLPLDGGIMTGNITVFTGASGRGLKFGTSCLNSLNNQLIWQSSEAIRFGSSDWDWNSWAGLKYDHPTKTIYLGLADSVIFKANSAQSGGTLKFPGVHQIVADSNSSTVGIPLVLKNSNWYGGMSTAIDFYNGSRYTVPNARIETKMNGDGRAGGTLIFYTLTAHATTNPNPNGLTERMRVGDNGIITITGQIQRSSGGPWINARDNAIIRQSYYASSNYMPSVAMKSASGYWSIGTIGSALVASYDTDANYNAGTNDNTPIYFPTSSGTLALISQIPTKTSQLTNDSNYVTGGPYIPLSGTTGLSGSIVMQGSSSTTPFIRNFTLDGTSGWAREIIDILVDGSSKFVIGAKGNYTKGSSSNSIEYAYIGCNNFDGLNLKITADSLKWGNNTILHAGNSSVSGGGSTWGSSITVKINGTEKTLTIPSIKTLTFSSGTFASKTYNGSADVAVNVPSNFNHIGDASNLYVDAGTVTRRIIVQNTKNNLGYVSRASIGLSNPANQFSPVIIGVGTNDGGTTYTDYYFHSGGSITDSKGNTYAKTSDIPTKTSQLNNDSNFITGGYIGTTPVLSSGAAQSLSSIINITATGNYTSAVSTSTSLYLKLANKDTAIGLRADSGTVRGVYDYGKSKWLVYSDGTDGNVLLGHVATSSTWSKSGEGTGAGIKILNAVNSSPTGTLSSYSIGLEVSGYYSLLLASKAGINDTLYFKGASSTGWVEILHKNNLGNTAVLYDEDIDTTIKHLGRAGYGYATNGWKTSGPAIAIGSNNGYTALILLQASSPTLYVSYKMNGGDVQAWNLIAFISDLTWDNITSKPSFFSGNYNDLINKPDLSNFVTGGPYLPLAGGTLTGTLTILGTSELLMKTDTSTLRLLAFNTSNYIQSANKFNGSVPLYISGYSGTTGTDLYLSFARVHISGNIHGTTNAPLNVNTTATSEVGVRLYMDGTSKVWMGYTPELGAMLYTYNNTGNGTHKIGVSDSGVGFLDSNTLLHSNNYTSYTPILNSSLTHATKSSVIYAPTSAGTSGYVLKSNGSGAPSWIDPSGLSVSYAELAGSATTAGTAYGLSKSFTVFGVSFNGAITTAVDMSTLIGVMGTGDSDITDSTHILTSHVNGFNSSGNTITIYKRTANYLWNYIKGKIDSTYTHGASGGYIGTTAVSSSLSSGQNVTGIGGIIPNTNTTYNCGTEGNLWKSVYTTNVYNTTAETMLISNTGGVLNLSGKTSGSIVSIDIGWGGMYPTSAGKSLGHSLSTNYYWGDIYAGSGNFTVNSTGAYHTSDIRKKTNITKARNLGIADLLVEFDWKDSDKHSWGYIAQDLLEVLPEAVDYNEDIDVYSVNYNVAHSAAIASLTARIKELEEKLKKYGIL